MQTKRLSLSVLLVTIIVMNRKSLNQPGFSSLLYPLVIKPKECSHSVGTICGYSSRHWELLWSSLCNWLEIGMWIQSIGEPSRMIPSQLTLDQQVPCVIKCLLHRQSPVVLHHAAFHGLMWYMPRQLYDLAWAGSCCKSPVFNFYLSTCQLECPGMHLFHLEPTGGLHENRHIALHMELVKVPWNSQVPSHR